MINRRVKKPEKISRAQKAEEGEKAPKAKKAIEERNRIALAYLELARDSIFQKMPEEEKN